MTDKKAYAGRFLYSRKGGWLGTPTSDLAAFLGKLEVNLLMTMRRDRRHKPDASLLYCDAPEGLEGARKGPKYNTSLMSLRGARFYRSMERGDKSVWDPVIEAFAIEFKRLRSEQPEDDGLSDQAREEETGAAIEPEIPEEEEHAEPQSQPVVFNRGGQALTTSLAVAAAYGKRHDHVLRDIEEILGGSPKLGSEFLFRKTSYVDGRGKTYPMYEMNEEAFCLLALAFTGPEAFRLRVAYIAEFKRMERSLSGQQSEQVDLNDPGVLRSLLISYTEKLQVSLEETRQAVAETVVVRATANKAIAKKDDHIAELTPKAEAYEERAMSKGREIPFRSAASDLLYDLQDLLTACTDQGLDRIKGSGLGWLNEAKWDNVHKAYYYEASKKGSPRFVRNRDFTVHHKGGTTTVKTYAVLTRLGFERLVLLKASGDLRLPGTLSKSGNKQPRSQTSFSDKLH